MESASLYEKNASEESMARHPNWRVYKKHPSWKLYEERVEPPGLKENKRYISLRQCLNLPRLQGLETYLEEHGKEYPDPVLVPWINRPYGDIDGYGIYSRKEAQELSKRAKQESWSDPRPGHAYDLAWLRERIKKIDRD